MEENNQHQYDTPAHSDPVQELKAHHLNYWRLLLDQLSSAKPPAPADQIKTCQGEIDRLTDGISNTI